MSIEAHKVEIVHLPAQDGFQVVKRVLLDGRELFVPEATPVTVNVQAKDCATVTFTVFAEVDIRSEGFYPETADG